MLEPLWGNAVVSLSIGRVKNLTEIIFPICFHGFSLGYSQLMGAYFSVVKGWVIPRFHNPNNNNFSILNINN